MLVRLGTSLSPFVEVLVSRVLGTFPFDATELLSPYEVLVAPLCCAGLFLPFSIDPFTPPLTDKVLPFCEDLWSQVLALVRPFGKELIPSRGVSPLVCTLPPSIYPSSPSAKLPFIEACEDLVFPLTFSWESRT